MKKKIILLALIIVVALIISIKPYLKWENTTFGTTHYTVKSKQIPREFDGYNILVLADIQGEIFGDNNDILINKIKSSNANMVVFVGDLVDDGVENSYDVINHILENSNLPIDTYAVSGNHDLWTKKFETMRTYWESISNIKFLENDTVTISKNGQSINLYGISDPNTWNDLAAKEFVYNKAKQFNLEKESFNILLFHRANMLDLFKGSEFDLILSGHMHGGQVRLPFVGGLKSPHGDWFPKYSGGKYDFGDYTYIVSRGLGNAVNVPRIFNRPEIVILTLKSL